VRHLLIGGRREAEKGASTLGLPALPRQSRIVKMDEKGAIDGN
jgi:hypothetical protein